MADTDLAQDPRPPAKVQTESYRKERPSIVGPDTPEAPFPIQLAGDVQRGFGRGGKDLGCPTANLPDDSLPAMSNVAQTGIYFGYAQISPSGGQEPIADEDRLVFPMVMSLGYNPFYDNKTMTAEIHVMHGFKADFYGHHLKTLVLGYIRPELDYTSREALVDDIETDKKVAMNSLARPGYTKYAKDSFFS